MTIQIQRVEVFRKAQRLTHWLVALGVVFQLVSAWLIQHANVDVLAWADWHSMVGQALILPILLRFYLMLLPGSGNWRYLLPTREQRHVVANTLRFYASLGRLPCPDWYAFNPLWQPVYAVLWLILLATTVSGFVSATSPGAAGLHSTLASIILGFTLAHVVFSVIHDVRGNGAQISAMLNGYKYFLPQQPPSGSAENSVSLASIVGRKPGGPPDD